MSVSFNVTGKFLKKEEELVISEKFTKRTFLVEVTVNPQYKEILSFDLINEKTALIEGFNEGDLVVVSFNIKCRESRKERSQGKYFTALQAWKISRYGEDISKNNSNISSTDNTSTGEESVHQDSNETVDDEIPF